MLGEIAVLRGGWSSERDVSLKSGEAVINALRKEGHTVRDVVVSKNPSQLLDDLTPKPNVIFNALHGVGGEDGVIQGILEMLEIPYTHSGVTASAVAMNKHLTRDIFAHNHIPVPGGGVYSRRDFAQGAIHLPCVVKPIADGSSVGIYVVFNESHKSEVLENWPADEERLIEEYIHGRELTVGVIGTQALPITEIIAESGFFDYTAKYDGKLHADFITPADLPEHVTEQAQLHAVNAHHVLGCRGASRTDFRYDPNGEEGNQLFALEINTQPGMTDLSLVPMAAKHLGISFTQLVVTLLEEALDGR